MFYQAQMPLFKLQTFNIYFTLRLEKFNPRGLKSIQLALGGEGRSGTGIANSMSHGFESHHLHHGLAQ